MASTCQSKRMKRFFPSIKINKFRNLFSFKDTGIISFVSLSRKRFFVDITGRRKKFF